MHLEIDFCLDHKEIHWIEMILKKILKRKKEKRRKKLRYIVEQICARYKQNKAGKTNI